MRLVTSSGESFSGKVIAVLDAMESDDELDNMTVEADNGEIRIFYPDNIESIAVIG